MSQTPALRKYDATDPHFNRAGIETRLIFVNDTVQQPLRRAALTAFPRGTIGRHHRVLNPILHDATEISNIGDHNGKVALVSPLVLNHVPEDGSFLKPQLLEHLDRAEVVLNHVGLQLLQAAFFRERDQLPGGQDTEPSMAMCSGGHQADVPYVSHPTVLPEVERSVSDDFVAIHAYERDDALDINFLCPLTNQVRIPDIVPEEESIFFRQGLKKGVQAVEVSVGQWTECYFPAILKCDCLWITLH